MCPSSIFHHVSHLSAVSVSPHAFLLPHIFSAEQLLSNLVIPLYYSLSLPLFSLFLSSVGWVTSSPATVAASFCWRRVITGISMSLVPAAPRCSPLGAFVTCSGTHTAATPCPPSETHRGRGREGLEERRRPKAGTEMEVEEEEQ